MIVPDVNLLVYAYNSAAPRHARARAWWEKCLRGNVSIGLPWLVSLGFIRICTSRRALANPVPATLAIAHVRAWLARPQVSVLTPGGRHLDLIEELMQATGATGALASDVHIAALALENQAELHSNDTDFGRFPGLRWHDPLA